MATGCCGFAIYAVRISTLMGSLSARFSFEDPLEITSVNSFFFKSVPSKAWKLSHGVPLLAWWEGKKAEVAV